MQYAFYYINDLDPKQLSLFAHTAICDSHSIFLAFLYFLQSDIDNIDYSATTHYNHYLTTMGLVDACAL
jgi:hypothetical protein